jgi:hypothetical protein
VLGAVVAAARDLSPLRGQCAGDNPAARAGGRRRDPGLDPGLIHMACASPPGRICFVVMPRVRDIGKANYARLRAHELGHCAGWAG